MQQKAATGSHSGRGFTFVERTQPKAQQYERLRRVLLVLTVQFVLVHQDAHPC